MSDNTQACRHEGINWNGEGDCITCARDKVLGDTQELDDILTKLARETTLADRAADIATTADGVKDASKRFQWSIGEAKQSLLDWHNKQIEAVLDRLLEHGEDFTTFGDAGRSVAVEYIEAERKRINKIGKT